MEKTELLYYPDPRRMEFDGKILSLEGSEGNYELVLDKTCFYPEGGGQPADRGTLNGLPVTHVRKQNGVVYHCLPEAPRGPQVHGQVDWDHRFDYMQQHTGQHILSAVLYHRLNYNTLSIHFGEAYTSIEIDTEEIRREELQDLEDAANELICRNLPVGETWTTSDRLGEFTLRRETAVTGDVRIISLDDYDQVACGGIHCRTTGEVGLVQAAGVEKIRGRVRLLFKIGGRAYKDYRLKTEVTDCLKALLSAQCEDLPDRLAAVLEENAALKQDLATLKRERIQFEAHRLYQEAVQEKNGLRRIAEILTGFDSREVIDLAKHLIDRPGTQVCLLLNRQEDLFWCLGCSAEQDFPFNACREELLNTIGGKGGGRHPLWQGMGTRPEGAEEFLKTWRRYSGKAV